MFLLSSFDLPTHPLSLVPTLTKLNVGGAQHSLHTELDETGLLTDKTLIIDILAPLDTNFQRNPEPACAGNMINV